MPRIYNSRSEPLDFCQRCFPKTEAEAYEVYGKLGDGPDGRGNCFSYDDEHPDYDYCDYICENCGMVLRNEDNDKER